MAMATMRELMRKRARAKAARALVMARKRARARAAREMAMATKMVMARKRARAKAVRVVGKEEGNGKGPHFPQTNEGSSPGEASEDEGDGGQVATLAGIAAR